MQNHDEFLKEQQRLEETKTYMDYILHQSKAEIESADDKIREAMANIDYLDSSDSFMNILTNSRFYELARTQKEALEKVRKKPYFARIHFQRKNEAEEFLYIGKTSLFDSETNEPIIVDWRSPVANVYYDGRLGDLTYKVRDEEHSGHLFAKRQYKIEEGMLLDYRDVDLTTNDELLQEALDGKADVRLTEIISTIQKEQNEIIRAHLKQPILVQGAAGSGKTTIALHRISYFLYTMGEHFNPEKLMILAPSKLFIDYIGEVLPELGVDRIKQTTFERFVELATNIKLKIISQNDMLEQIVENDTLAQTNALFFYKQKGSAFYKNILDRIVESEIKRIAALFDDVFIEKYRILKGSHLKKLFLIDFAYMPVEKRLERIQKVVQTEVKRKAKIVVHTVKAKYDEAIERSLNGMRDAEKRKRVVTKYLDEREERIPKIELEAKTTTKTYMRKFSKINVLKLYRQFLSSTELVNLYVPEWDSEEVTAFIQHHKKENWTLDDGAALLYLTAKLKGIEEDEKMQVVFIDEVQDYSLMQIIALKEALETDMFTMVGDLAQGIHHYRSISDWEPVIEQFPRITYATLQKSYRTTVEIMEEANMLLSKMDENLPLVEPVVRHGKPPQYIFTEQFDTEIVIAQFHELASKHKSIALITKTNAEAVFVKEALNNRVKTQLLQEDSSIKADSSTLLIVPSYLAKGLEFDAAMIVIVHDEYKQDSLDRKLLYVAFTRAMHDLVCIGPSKESFLM